MRFDDTWFQTTFTDGGDTISPTVPCIPGLKTRLGHEIGIVISGGSSAGQRRADFFIYHEHPLVLDVNSRSVVGFE